MQHTIHLTKSAGRSLLGKDGDTKIIRQLDVIVSGAVTQRRLSSGWRIELDSTFNAGKPWREDVVPGKNITSSYLYHSQILVSLSDDKTRPTTPIEFHNIVNALAAKAAGMPGSGQKWTIADVDGDEWDLKSVRIDDTQDGKVKVDAAEAIGYAPIIMPPDDEWQSNFNHLYGLDDAIARVKSALDLAIRTNWTKRINTVLIGPPGCGKSDLCRSLKAALGEDSVLEFDGTSTTQAGAQKEIEEREELPRILLVEEIEKAPEGSMQWLLSLMDIRSEIRKVTARASSNILRDTKMLTIATVNDIPTFNKASFGALASRFSGNKIYFQRPSRDLLTKILMREVTSVNGNLDWIEPALDFSEAINTTDPREVIAICLLGGDNLLTGEYQRQMLATGLPSDSEDWDTAKKDEAQMMRRNVAKLVARIDATDEQSATSE